MNSKKAMKWGAAVVVIALVAWFAWQQNWFKGSGGEAGNTPSSTMSPQSNKTDAALVQDSAAIDAQLQVVGSASADAQASDQPIEQSSL